MASKGHFFETFGPFRIPLRDGRFCRPSSKWWDEEVDLYVEGLSKAIGCYMFTLGDRHIKPWYIGRTVNQKGFRRETFETHKLKHYNSLLEENKKGPPGLYLFPLLTGDFSSSWYRFASGTSHSPPIDWLEKTLMGMAYAQNQKLLNTKDVTFFKTVRVRGILGKSPAGPPHGDIPQARQALLGVRPNDR